MEYKEFIQYFALVIMAWEFIKLFIPHVLWKNAKIVWSQKNLKDTPGGNMRFHLQEQNPFLKFMGGVYGIFILLMLFTKWWWVTIALLLLSTATLSTLRPLLKRNKKFNLTIYLVLIVDFVFTMALLSVVNPYVVNMINLKLSF